MLVTMPANLLMYLFSMEFPLLLYVTPPPPCLHSRYFFMEYFNQQVIKLILGCIE